MTCGLVGSECAARVASNGVQNLICRPGPHQGLGASKFRKERVKETSGLSPMAAVTAGDLEARRDQHCAPSYSVNRPALPRGRSSASGNVVSYWLKLVPKRSDITFTLVSQAWFKHGNPSAPSIDFSNEK